MGKTNQQRRAAKARAKARRPAAGAAGRPDLSDEVRRQCLLATQHLAYGRTAEFAGVVTTLASPPHQPSAADWRRAVRRELHEGTLGWVAGAWHSGWEPADLSRIVRRRCTPEHVALLHDAVAAEIGGYAPTTVAPRWFGQLTALGATVRWPGDRSWLDAEPDRPWPTTVRLTLELVHTLRQLPSLERLGPVPGEATHVPAAARPDVDARILEKVRALLAKAESTNYPAEAETFTAGAHAMMARHRIDRALLDATRSAPPDGPVGRRVGIDNPYEGPKTMLLQAVAEASGCKTVWNKGLGFATVVGHADDLDAVELLFTSLLVQATTAMTGQGTRRYADGGSRTRSFRQSFLVSYAGRIGERLAETTEEQTREAAAETGRADLLPVLAARGAAVEEATAKLFPALVSRTVRSVHDREGWASGRAAADLASLQRGAALDR